MALPGNKIPRLFINTGIEYKKIVKFVTDIKQNDNRVVMLKPVNNIKETLESNGYPFKSKEHSEKWFLFRNGSKSNRIKRYTLGETSFDCPKKLLYQFSDDFLSNPPFIISKSCCEIMKKNPARQWAKENGKKYTITGMRREEGGARNTINCVSIHSGRISFNPLQDLSEQWIDWFVYKFNIKLCELYYPPYNFTRTGCKGCPFNKNLQKDLDMMSVFLPEERKQCEMIWKPVYEEYRRINYRLKKPYNPDLF